MIAFARSAEEKDVLSTAQRVMAVIAECFGRKVEDVAPDDRIFEDFEADSLDLVCMATALADEFGMELFKQWIDGCQTVQNLIDHVEGILETMDD